MSLMSVDINISNRYIIGLLNSNLIFDYYRVFVNCTVNIQINDLRQIPIIIPSRNELAVLNSLVDIAVKIKKLASYDSNETNSPIVSLDNIEKEINKKVNHLYCI